MLTQVIIYAISLLAIVLGFVALLKQKTYIDSETKNPTEIEIPTLGKLKTNYPALVFVFLGFAAAIFAFSKSEVKEKVHWAIKGRLVDTTHKIEDWREGDIRIIPFENTTYSIDKNTGAYTIDMDIDKGLNFEDVANCIVYSHKLGNAQLYPMDEFTNHKKGKPSLLRGKTNPTRFYGDLLLSNFQ